MTRYIDADALLELFPDEIDGLQTYNAEVQAIINSQPTIEAVPVKRGKWIKADSQQYFRKHYPAFTCSECGQRKDSQKTWNYCPYCGARMDKE